MAHINGQQLSEHLTSQSLTIEDLATLERIARGYPQLAQFLRDINSIGDTVKGQDPWAPYTLVDAYKKLMPIEYIVEGVLTIPCLGIVFGAPGTLKSFLLADLIACVAAGKVWLPSPDGSEATFGWHTHSSPCMWIDFDNGIRRTHERFSALGKAYGLPDTTPIKYYTMPVPRLDGTDKTSIGMLSQRVKDNMAKLVIIDNLGYVSGGAEENSSEMVQVMSNFRELVEETQATIILIHHQRKSNGYKHRAGESLRGHSSIEGALDLALQVERVEEADRVIVKSTKDRGEKVKQFAAVFSFEKNPDGTLASARFFGDSVDHSFPKKHDPLEEKVDQLIIENIKSTEKNKHSLVEKVQEQLGGIGEKKIGLRIDALTDQKLIGVKPGSKPKEKVFYILEKTTRNQQLPLTTASCEIEEGF